MGRSQETYNKKEVRKKKEKKRKDKEQKRLAKKDSDAKGGLNDMLAYVDQNGNITSEPPDPTKKEKVKAEDIEIGIPARDPNDEPSNIREGVVTFFNDSKGYGFIRDKETKENVFVHINNVLEDIREGNKVSFEVEKGLKGLTATQVRVVR